MRTPEEWAAEEWAEERETRLRKVASHVSHEVLARWAAFTGPHGREEKLMVGGRRKDASAVAERDGRIGFVVF